MGLFRRTIWLMIIFECSSLCLYVCGWGSRLYNIASMLVLRCGDEMQRKLCNGRGAASSNSLKQVLGAHFLGYLFPIHQAHCRPALQCSFSGKIRFVSLGNVTESAPAQARNLQDRCARNLHRRKHALPTVVQGQCVGSLRGLAPSPWQRAAP